MFSTLLPIIYEGAFVGATVVDVEIDRLGTLHNRIGLIGAPWWLYDEDSMLIGKSGDLESGTAVNLTESDRILTSVITKSSEKGSSLINQARSSDAISAIRILDPTKNDKSVLSLCQGAVNQLGFCSIPAILRRKWGRYMLK